MNSAIAGSRRISLAGTTVVLALLFACGGKKKAEPAAPDEVENREVEPAATVIEVDAGVATGAGLPPSVPNCAGYINATTSYASCPKLDPQTRSSLLQGVDAMKEAWAQLATITDPAVLQQVDDACKQALDAIRQSAITQGCPI